MPTVSEVASEQDVAHDDVGANDDAAEPDAAAVDVTEGPAPLDAASTWAADDALWPPSAAEPAAEAAAEALGSGLSRAEVASMDDEQRLAAAIEASLRDGDSDQPLSRATSLSARTALTTLAANPPRAVQCTAEELLRATDGFSSHRVLGAGGFGQVFGVSAGQLPSIGHARLRCAVKRLDADSMQGMEELRNEVQVYSICRHEHLLPLLGYCFEPEARCLVYPLMEGGNLEDAILRPARGASGASAGEPVDWRARVRILRDVARALLYLHSPSGAKGIILHRDMKPANILLDGSLNAKLADVGLAKAATEAVAARGQAPSIIGHRSEQIKGTFGYLCPSYVETGMFTVHADAYAFGITMLVLLTGRDARPAADAAQRLLGQLTSEELQRQADPLAGWPSHAEGAGLQLVRMVVGLTAGRQLRARTPLAEVAAELERCAEAAHIRAGLANAGGGSTTGARPDEEEASPRECTVCMAEPRAVRFMCGHMVCCEQCTDILLSRRGQNACPACRTRIVVAARGAHLAAEHTFVQQPTAARSSLPTAQPPPATRPSSDGSFVDLGAASSRAAGNTRGGLRRSASGLARVFSFGRRQGRASGR